MSGQLSEEALSANHWKPSGHKLGDGLGELVKGAQQIWELSSSVNMEMVQPTHREVDGM